MSQRVRASVSQRIEFEGKGSQVQQMEFGVDEDVGMGRGSEEHGDEKDHWGVGGAKDKNEGEGRVTATKMQYSETFEKGVVRDREQRGKKGSFKRRWTGIELQ